MLRSKQNSKSVDLLDFGHSDTDIEKVPNEEKSSKIKNKSFVKFSNSGVLLNNFNNTHKSQPSRSFLKSQQQQHRKIRNLITSAYQTSGTPYETPLTTQTNSYAESPLINRRQKRKSMSRSFINKQSTSEKICDLRNRVLESRRNIKLIPTSGNSTAATHQRIINNYNKESNDAGKKKKWK